MTSIYFRELAKYTFEEILKKFNIQDRKEGIGLITKLKAYGIVKTLRITPEERDLSALNDEEIDLLDDNIEDKYKRYVFKFVGVLTIQKYVIICYPKYIKKNEKPEIEMKQILKVIKKYNADEQIINLYNGSSNEQNFNYLAIILFLLNDYYENGIYSNQEEIIEINGEGEILWNRTINEIYGYISNNRPYYLELYTINSVENSGDYFTRLHQAILTECSRNLVDANINRLLDVEEVELIESNIEEFGDKEYILYRLEKELNNQYATQKQMILKTLYTYIANRKTNNHGIGISFYGTNHFNLVWEKVCAEVLDNKLNTKLRNLPLNIFNNFEDKKDRTLKELIEKPLWEIYDGKKERKARETLIPDLISIFKIDKEYGFAIFDAKYYDINFNDKKIWGQPGVNDITKQYLYQLAYKEFIEDSGYKFVTNAFLIPSEKSEMNNIGQAKMKILTNIVGENLKNIEIIELDAKKMYEFFIGNRIMKVEQIVSKLNNKKDKQNNYEIELNNNLGAKVIFNSIKKIISSNFYGMIDSKEIRSEDYNYLNESSKSILYNEVLGRIAIAFDRLFKKYEKIDLVDIEEEMEKFIEINEQREVLMCGRLLRKLKDIHDEYYLVIYWDK